MNATRLLIIIMILSVAWSTALWIGMRHHSKDTHYPDIHPPINIPACSVGEYPVCQCKVAE